MRLITLPFSHYCERARWALERYGINYREEKYLPTMHFPAVLLATRGRGQTERYSTRLSTPVLVTDDRACITDSGDIVRYCSDQFSSEHTSLYPTNTEQREQVIQLEKRYAQELGPHTRRIAYYILFRHEDLLIKLVETNAPRWQARIFKIGLPLIRRSMARAMGITSESYARSLAKVRRILDEDAQRVRETGYLVGDCFSAADLTLASLMAPAIMPTPEDGFGAVLPTIEELPPEGAELVASMRDTPVGRFADRMYKQERLRTV